MENRYPKFTSVVTKGQEEIKQLIPSLCTETGLRETVVFLLVGIMKESSTYDKKSLLYQTKIEHHHLIIVHIHESLFKENMGPNGSNPNDLQSCKYHLGFHRKSM